MLPKVGRKEEGPLRRYAGSAGRFSRRSGARWQRAPSLRFRSRIEDIAVRKYSWGAVEADENGPPHD